MKHQYDWSKLGAGWEERAGELRYYEDNGTVYPFGVAWLENNNRYLRELDPRWHELHDQARAQLTKWRVEPKPKYDWSKLDAGWVHRPETDDDYEALITPDHVHFSVNGLERWEHLGSCSEPIERQWAQARAQLAKCRIVDNTPLLEAMDKMASEIPAEEWKKVPQYPDGLRCKSCGADRPHECPGPGGWVIPRHDPTLFVQEPSQPCPEFGQHGLHVCESPTPSQPWRRGPLAVWTLVNISCHDGRLTVVMKRGRGELVMETGPDDETLWERLAAKASTYQQR